MPRLPLPEMPLVKKELVGLLRTKRAFWFLVTAVAATSLLSLVAWPSGASGVTDSRFALAAVGTFLLTQLTAALVIVPAFAAGAISGEREQGTYEVLLATPLSPTSIVFSKALAAAGYVVILLVASAPGIIVIHLLGGVTFGSIIRCEAVTLAAVVLSTFICLSASMRTARTSRAIAKGVGGVILWNGGLLWILSLLLMITGGLAGDVWESLGYALSPHLVIALEVFGGEGFFGGASLSADAWLIHLGSALAVSGCYLLLLLPRAGVPEPPAPRRWRGAETTRPTATTPTPRPFLTTFLLDIGHDIRIFANPIFRKEIRSEFFGRLWYRRRRFWGVFILFGALAVSRVGGWGVEAVLGIVGTSTLLVALLAPGVAAGAFPREIEQGNLDFLRGTLVPLPEVLRGKFLASLYANLGIIAAAGWWIALVSLVQAIEDVMVVTPVLAFAILVTTWVFVTAVATLASAISKRTITALLGSYGVLFAWYVVLPTMGRGLLGLDFSFSVVTHPQAALVTLVEPSMFHGGALVGFFLFHAGSIFVMLLVAGRAVEALRERDA